MKGLYEEIFEIPEKAQICYEKNKNIKFPKNLFYIGMGSSYFAPLALKYSSLPLHVEMASEFFNYSKKKLKTGVLISQSGKSSETLWCIKKMERYIAIVNNINSPLSQNKKCIKQIPLFADHEHYSSTKTYINTLIALYQGFGIDTKKAVEMIEKKIVSYERFGRENAKKLKSNIKHIYLIGNGPNIATAKQGALVLSETTKIPATGMFAAEYDHGPKETGRNSIVIAINLEGKSFERTKKLIENLRKFRVQVFEIEEDIPEIISPIVTILPIFFLMYYFAKEFGIKETFSIGNKITEV